MLKYEPTSLADLCEYFAKMRDIARNKLKAAPKKSDREYHKGEIDALNMVIAILSASTIKPV